ncbi:MAG: polysaccharide pyruvyl transferase family protein [Firmicutes bacterium]|nr:polysaccharide pyruvyl transferase family protein [Bacillota bacterium]
MMKISIIGATFTGNRGAEAMLTTTIGRIREKYPEAEFNVYSYYPQDDRRLLRDGKVKVYSSTPLFLIKFFLLCILFRCFQFIKAKRICAGFPKSVLALSDSNVLLDMAGVSFIDGREKFLPFNILTILPAFILGVPVVKLAQAMGPFHGLLNRLSAKFILTRCRKVFARGERTYDNLLQLGLDSGKIERASDLAFLHRPGDSLTCENQDYLQKLLKMMGRMKASGGVIIGLCPSSVIAAKARKTGWDYVGFTAQIARELMKQGHKILLLPNATREAESSKLRNNDLPLIRAIAAELMAKNSLGDSMVYVDKDLNNDGIRQLISNCDVGLVSRFHAMVATLSLGVPVFVIGWSHKYLEVMEQFQQAEWVCDYQKTDLQSLIQKIGSLIAGKDQQSRVIQDQLKGVQRESFKQFHYLFDFLANQNIVESR